MSASEKSIRRSEGHVTKKKKHLGGCDPGGSSTSNVYWLKWNTQTSHLAAELANIFQQGGDLSLTDVTLACEDGQFVQAHRLILSLCSPYFRRLFQVNRADKGNTIVILSNIKFQFLRNILAFVYKGEVDILSNELDAFLETGKILQIQGLGEYYSLNENEEMSEHYNDDLEDERSGMNSDGVDKNHDFPIRIRDPRSLRSKRKSEYSTGTAYFKNKKSKGGVNEDDCDDNVSNFSDDCSVNNDDSSDEVSDKEQKIVTSGGRQRKRKNARHDWTEIEPVTPKELEDNWRRDYHKKSLTGSVTVYYCGFAREHECPCLLKEEVFAGKTLYFTNRAAHANHRLVPLGIGKEAKKFVEKAYEEGLRTPGAIIRRMQMEKITPPTKSKISNYLTTLRRKVDPEYGKNKQKSGDNTDGSTKDTNQHHAGTVKRKRGRPRRNEEDFAKFIGCATSTSPSQQQQPSSTIALTHPSSATSTSVQQAVVPPHHSQSSLPSHLHQHPIYNLHQSHVHGLIGVGSGPPPHDDLSFLHHLT